MRATFLRLLEVEEKEGALRNACRDQSPTAGGVRFDIETSAFRSVPRCPLAYWVPERVRELFGRHSPFESGGRICAFGASTKGDTRYVRLWYEVDPNLIARVRAETESVPWVLFAKGGSFSRHYSDIYLVVNWMSDGKELKADISEYRGSRGWGFQWSAALNGHALYFRAGLTWPRRSQLGFSMRAMPAGCIFNDVGPAAFVPNDDQKQLLACMALGSSSVFRYLLGMLMAFGKFEVGPVQRTPAPDLGGVVEDDLSTLARRAWSLKRSLDTSTESSHGFSLPALLQSRAATLGARAAAWMERVVASHAELAVTQASIDERCFGLYGIGEEERRAITAGFGTPAAEPGADAASPLDDETDAEDAEAAFADATSLTAELVSWAAGAAFGRFDIRLATGERVAPPEPDPFDPLPVSSPGMLTGDDGLPLASPPLAYPLAFPVDGVLVDDPGHPRDLTAAVRAVLNVVFGADADARWREAAELLDAKGHDLRAWLSGSFFAHHLKHYSKSRRKAPISWQLATASGGYSVWLYARRLTSDTFFHLQNDVVAPKLAHEERKLAALVQDGGPNPTASSRKVIDRQETFVEELRGLREEVARVAPLWNPDLNDGVLLTAAPLWRLVPQHRAWQKELRSAWESLAAGTYDWAHLAMHLWPERVVPKCATDRSLAIAHGLEEVFWEEGANGKWTPRKTPLTPIPDLVAARTSPAVKAALKELLDAPSAPRGTGRASGRGRAQTSLFPG